MSCNTPFIHIEWAHFDGHVEAPHSRLLVDGMLCAIIFTTTWYIYLLFYKNTVKSECHIYMCYSQTFFIPLRKIYPLLLLCCFVIYMTKKKNNDDSQNSMDEIRLSSTQNITIDRPLKDFFFWKSVETISFKLSDGKNPPVEINDIVRLSELNKRIPEIFKSVKIIKLRTQ